MRLLFFPCGYREDVIKQFVEESGIEVRRLSCENGYLRDMITVESKGGIFATDIPTFLREHSWYDKGWEIYFYIDGRFVVIQDLTEKILREAHNIENMFLNGGFNVTEPV